MEYLSTKAEVQAIIAESDELRSAQVVAMGDVGSAGSIPLAMLRCACCEQYTLHPALENEQCTTCGWINDLFQNTHPDSLQGQNAITLSVARQQWNDRLPK